MPATARPILGHTAVRPSWDTMPAGLRDGIARRLGSSVEHAESQAGGFTPGLAARLRLADGGSAFVKAVPADHPVAPSYRHEAGVAALLPPAVPAPALRWHADIAGWTVLAFDDVQGRYPDFVPPAADLPAVTGAVTAAQATVIGLPAAGAHRAGWLHGWTALAAAGPADALHPWAAAHLSELADVETAWLPHADGDTLTHGDLRPDNILITADGAMLIDWAHATAGAPWLDLADLAAQLIIAGHHPADAERHLVGLPAWHAAPPVAITGYAAALAGYWTRSAAQPSPPGVPNLRAYQSHAASTAIGWLAWRWQEQP